MKDCFRILFLFLFIHNFSFPVNQVFGWTTTVSSHVQFISPLLEEGYPPTVQEYKTGVLREKPLLLYLPGFDGTLLAPFLQFPRLGMDYDIWGMTVDIHDRSTLEDLKTQVLQFLQTQSGMETRGESNTNGSNRSRRPFYIMGESFGGILGLEVASAIAMQSTLWDQFQGMVLINPATCYPQSPLAVMGPKVTKLPSMVYPWVLPTLLPLFTDDYALPQLLLMLQGKALPCIIDTKEKEAYMGRTAFSLPHKLPFMPRETLSWRLEEWLRKGSHVVLAKESQIKNCLASLPILIVSGEMDKTLPSVSEAERLHAIFDNCQIHIVNGSGHANTSGSRVDLASLMRKRFHMHEVETTSSTKKDDRYAESRGVMLGMDHRYDGSFVGLSPFLYWSSSLYENCNYRDTP